MPDSTSTTKASPDTRLIFGLMMWTVGFALVGHEVNVKSGTASLDTTTQSGLNALAQNQLTGTTEGAKIIIGGFAATAVLAMLAHAGDPGRTFAVGLAVIAAVSSTLVFGKPVWQLLDKLVGGAGPGGKATGSTTPTKGTVATAGALAQAA